MCSEERESLRRVISRGSRGAPVQKKKKKLKVVTNRHDHASQRAEISQ